MRSRYIAVIQTGRFVKTAVAHTQTLCLGIHSRNECVNPARISTRQRVGRTVFAAHQAQVQQFLARQRRTDTQTATRTFQPVDFFRRNRNQLVHVQIGIQQHNRTHQFGNRRNRHHAVGVFLIQHFTGFVVHNQGRLRRKQRPRHHRLRFYLLSFADC